jgi:hypothetical protein
VSELNAMETLAQAAFYIPELARGLDGEVEIKTEDWGEEEHERVKAEIHQAQALLYLAGWRQDRTQEWKLHQGHSYTGADYACYRKQFKPGQQSRWISVVVTWRCGLRARFKGRQVLSW